MFSACRKMTPEMMVYTSPGQTDRMNLHEPQVTDALCGAPCWKKQLMEALWQLQLQHIPLQSLQMIKNVFVSGQIVKSCILRQSKICQAIIRGASLFSK
jgi:hypothetical protein